MNIRKHLNADSLIEQLKDCFKEISDHRAKNVKFSLSDVLMSGYAMFSLKCSSLLKFDEKRDDAEEMENIKAVYGVEDKIINFLTCHKISEVDRVYWSRWIEGLRKIYTQRQQCLNPISLKREYGINKLKDIKAKIRELEGKIKELEKIKTNSGNFDVKIVASEEEIIEFAKIGYDCQSVGVNKWLMKKQICP